MNELSLRLSVVDANLRDRVASAVDALVSRPGSAARLTVDLSGEQLPAPVVSTLIAALRKLREVGGSLVVVPQTGAIRDALALHGLDRVFAAPLDPEPATHSGRWRPGRAAVAALLALAVPFFGAMPARADQPDTGISNDAALIIERVIDRNPELTSFQGRLHVDVALISFPFFRQHLDATTYYKRPSNYEVVFDRLPSYARGFEKLYTDIGDPQNWAKHFTITYEGETPYRNRRDVTLRMVQRVRGMIDHETVLIDPAQFTIDQIRYDYYNGGHITMSQEFRQVGDYLLLASQDADIAIPHVRARAQGRYDGYRTNVAVDDAVFARKSEN